MSTTTTITLTIAHSDTGNVDFQRTYGSLNQAMRDVTAQAAEWPGVFVNDGLDHNGIDWDVVGDDFIAGQFVNEHGHMVATFAIEA